MSTHWTIGERVENQYPPDPQDGTVVGFWHDYVLVKWDRYGNDSDGFAYELPTDITKKG